MLKTMGLILEGYKISVDIPLSGFHWMRHDIAIMFDQDLADHYLFLMNNYYHIDYREYDRQTQKLADAFESKNGYLFTKQLYDFMYQSDCAGKASYGLCKRICNYLSTHRESEFFTVVYGYPGWNKPITGKDLLEVFQSCVDHKKSLKWW